MVALKRFEVWLVNLDPTIGSEINKSRPCVIISPDEANMYLNTVIVVPLTSTLRSYPTRVNCVFQEKQGQLAIDQIRTIDKQRLFKKLGAMDEPTGRTLCATIEETFRY